MEKLERTAKDLGIFELPEPIWCMMAVYDGWMSDRDHFAARPNQTTEAVLRWVESFVKLHGNRKVKTEPRMSGQHGPLRRLAGIDFREATMIREMDVIIGIMAGPTESKVALQKKFENVAFELLLQNMTSVMLYYIDADMNDLPGFARGNPPSSEIFMWPGGPRRTQIQIPVDLNADSLVAFVAEHGSTTKPRNSTNDNL
jgi:hypothetical protein